MRHYISFSCECWGLDSGPRAYVASMEATELSSPAQVGEIYCSMVLEGKSVVSRCQEDSWSLWRECFLASS